MNARHRFRYLALGLALIAGLFFAGDLRALVEEGVLPWTVDAGGGHSSGGGFDLDGSFGQADAGPLRHDASGLELQGGFWGAAELIGTGTGGGPPGRREASELLPPAPNPFNPATTVRFRLHRTGRVRLEILDVKGRLVRVLANEPMAAGEHSLRWQGRDDRGRTVSSGVYYLRMTTDGYTGTQKLSLVK